MKTATAILAIIALVLIFLTLKHLDGLTPKEEIKQEIVHKLRNKGIKKGTTVRIRYDGRLEYEYQKPSPYKEGPWGRL